MYSLYKYHEVMQMEDEYKEEFAKINPCKNIDILPPVFRKYKGKYVLAFLVIPQPEDNNHHLAVYRPIGAILRKLNSRRVVKIINCAQEEFAPNRNDFMLEYYNLETDEDFWPNRTPENEEIYRVALEKLLKIVQTMHFGVYRKKLYAEYLEHIYQMFSQEYLYFFECIAHNPIIDIDEDLEYQRELAKKEHEIRMRRLMEKNKDETAIAKKRFIEKIKEHLQFFIRKEILPTLKNKPGYAKIDFYRFVGKLYRDILVNTDKYLKCYDATLTSKAVESNLDDLKEKLKVSLIKTYAKACVKPETADESLNAISNEIIRFMDTMLLQEVTKNVTDKSKDSIKTSIIKIERMISRFQNPQLKADITEVYESLKNDYFNVISEEEMSDVYLGCMMTDIVI